MVFLNEKKTEKNNSLISEVSLYRGIQLFNDQKLQEALPLFVAGKKATEVSIREKSKYWEAETLYQLDNPKEALSKFTALKKDLKSKDEDFKLIDYNIGYSNFTLKNYADAAVSFENFLKDGSLEKDIKDDAYIRLGDSYFAIRNYRSAINAYTTVVNTYGAEADYAQYQIGMSYGFIEDNQAKITALTNVVNKYQISNLKDDALFQLANTYTVIKENNNAHNAYNRLIEKHPNSIFLPKALVRQGLLYYSENESKKALEKFKQTTKSIPKFSRCF